MRIDEIMGVYHVVAGGVQESGDKEGHSRRAVPGHLWRSAPSSTHAAVSRDGEGGVHSPCLWAAEWMITMKEEWVVNEMTTFRSATCRREI